MFSYYSVSNVPPGGSGVGPEMMAYRSVHVSLHCTCMACLHVPIFSGTRHAWTRYSHVQ